MKPGISRYAGIAATLLCLFLLITGTQAASDAVRNALGICARIILPSLLPFFFISGLMSALGLPQLLAGISANVMNRLFSVSGYAATPLFLGLLGGYPVGAASLAELVKEGKLSVREAERLLPFCNNTGPAFIIGAVGGGIFSSARVGALLYFVHILAAISVGLLFSGKSKHTSEKPVVSETEYGGIISALPQAVKSSVDKCLGICGFVIFFSILISLMDGPITTLSLWLDRVPGMEIGFCKSLLCGIMELGGGIASMSAMVPSPRSYALAAFVLGFGSLSVHCQTLAVVNEAKIKCARHFAGRIVHGVLSALYAFVLASLLRI